MSRHCRIPRKFQNAKLSDLDVAQFSMVLKYAETKKKLDGVGLLLCGPPGIGKTFSVSALTLHFRDEALKQQRFFDYEFITSPALFRRVQSFNGKVEMDSYRNRSWLETYTSVPWLVINDLGKENRQGGYAEQVVCSLGEILRDRDEKGLTTHITTNLQLAAKESACTVRGVYGESIASLLSEMCRAFTIVGKDRRRAK